MTMRSQARASERPVRLCLDLPPELHTTLKAAAARRRLTMTEMLRQILESSLVALGEGPAAQEDLDDLAIRRELAAASVAALGDFWDSEVDAQWQTFQP